MERNEQTLSTHNLASTDDRGAPCQLRSAAVRARAARRQKASTRPERLLPRSRPTRRRPAPDLRPTAPVPEADTWSGEPLLTPELGAAFQRRWKRSRTRFVDDPPAAVEQADGLVANLMPELADGFAKEREHLEAQWDRGEDISTEDLRVALRRSRSFFQRLL